MINHIWTVICTKSVIDSETNNISLIDTIELLTVNVTSGAGNIGETINLAINFEIISLWERFPYDEPIRRSARLQVKLPDGTYGANPCTFEVNLSTTHRTRSRVRVNSFEIKDEGRYLIVMELADATGSWSQKHEIPLEIRFQDT